LYNKTRCINRQIDSNTIPRECFVETEKHLTSPFFNKVYKAYIHINRGGATGYARYALAYPADPACIRVYILYLKKKQKQKNTYL
jgi:hypothetical protein